MLIYYLPAHDEIDLVSAVLLGKKLQTGDHLIIGNKPTIKAKQRFKLQKWLRNLLNLRPYQHYVQPVILVTLSLLGMISLATVTYLDFDRDITLAVEASFRSFVTGVLLAQGDCNWGGVKARRSRCLAKAASLTLILPSRATSKLPSKAVNSLK